MLLAAEPDSDWQLAWAQLTGSGELGIEDLMTVCPAFNQGDHARLLAPYAAEYFARMPAIWASRGDAARALLAKALFPCTAASPELLSQIEEFLTDHAIEPGLARIVIEGRDVAEKALRARTLPG